VSGVGLVLQVSRGEKIRVGFLKDEKKKKKSKEKQRWDERVAKVRGTTDVCGNRKAYSGLGKLRGG